ncbi:MAG TPA: hypothetical protein PLL94_09470 [Bacteroidales bacterium]|nr:hypothetical protein [Bacteroidales bacterium]HQK68362.1 hypothetical protein [Bacteroidales bacterium]
MKKPLLIVIIILAVILALPVINLIRWSSQTKKPMGIIIVDKTVPTPQRVKHKSFNWVLTNNRFVKKDKNKSYSFRTDYFGFVPTRPLKERQWDRNEYRLADLADLPEQADALYITDTYGVFFNDWYQGVKKSRTSTKLYGGLNNNDNLLIKEMKDRNKLIILEYNSFDYPTAEFESYRIQERLNIKFNGWTGKYFSSLDTTRPGFPIWMTSMYRKQYRKPWNFVKPGIVILNQRQILILEEGTQLKSSLPVIVTDSAYCSKWDLPPSITFDNWFDIIDPLDNNVISNFKLETTSTGDTLLSDYGLDNLFPAVIQEPAAQRTYYFSGDFTNTDVPIWTSKFFGVEKLKGILYSKKADDTRRFFWLYYRPLIKGIFNDYYNSLSSK